jgi:hypothetical protein
VRASRPATGRRRKARKRNKPLPPSQSTRAVSNAAKRMEWARTRGEMTSPNTLAIFQMDSLMARAGSKSDRLNTSASGRKESK